MKWSLIAAGLLVVCAANGASDQARDDGKLWIPTSIKWTRIQGALRNEKKRTASTVVLYFGKDGAFVRDECWLIRDGKSISISDGDPHDEYVGRMSEPMFDGAKYTYRLVRRTVERPGEVLPGPMITEIASPRAKSGLAMGGRNRFFQRVKFANESEYVETYSNLAKQFAQE
jgi:hypothetical protein